MTCTSSGANPVAWRGRQLEDALADGALPDAAAVFAGLPTTSELILQDAGWA
ncbi:hypothetical protein [Arthrobacter sp. ISL-28]|uniref:hypothetical protein n=1 Tax=Arthrobacter sp. ISL-28 TaxID=2819108 RepID=UPI001BE7BC3B|nr:hypothetical protein [Arthrobacter sp. ISL-28]MBT2522591.1 hypothetical protein [Arthrobacter sp. ISL-28]